MEINVSKTKHMTFSTLLDTPSNQYFVGNGRIETVSSFKYLGIFFTSDLSWSTHIEYITNKALKKLGFLKRRLFQANSNTKLHAYISLIRSTLEYASVIWHPHQASFINSLEAVQNKAARFILRSYSSDISVSALKRSLDLPNLDTRRKFSRLSFFHSLYYSESSFRSSNILPAHHISPRTDHAHKVQPIFARTKKYQNSPLALSIQEWNLLPASLVHLTESSSFQTALHSFITQYSDQ